MDGQVQEKELEVQAKTSALTQTEQDLANAIVIIQEREAELARVKNTTQKPVTFSLTDDDADNVPTSSTSSRAGFGTKFPADPQKGDMFLRVDMLPNKLYKWNGQKWIEVAKSTTDRYAYEEEYIQYLLQKIRTREYTIDDLSPVERDQVIRRMSYNEKGKL